MPEQKIEKVLVANRGEIAIRIFRACYDLGLHTVAMYSAEDTYSLFRTRAYEAYLIGEGKTPLGAYLDIPGIVDLAKRRGVSYIHPGYGFLSENPAFAKACEDNGITFIGPPSDVLGKMGDKLSAKEIAKACNVPTVPSCTEPLKDGDEALWKIVKAADKIAALIKCIEEQQAGNTEFRQALSATKQSIAQMHLPEADAFLDEFLGGFYLSLDEQQGVSKNFIAFSDGL